VVPASAQFAIRVASVVASATFPVVGLAHTVIVSGSVSRRDEIGGSKHQAQDGQDGECDRLHGNSLLGVRAWRLGLFLRQPLRASADEWESGKRIGVLALKDFILHSALARTATSPESSRLIRPATARLSRVHLPSAGRRRRPVGLPRLRPTPPSGSLSRTCISSSRVRRVGLPASRKRCLSWPAPLPARHRAPAQLRRLRFSGQWDKLRADRSKEA
jgi:hypothetical protein